MLARDGRYHVHVEPDRAAQVDLWLRFKGTLWALTDAPVDAAALCAAVPPYQAEEFERRLSSALETLTGIRREWEKRRHGIAAE